MLAIVIGLGELGRHLVRTLQRDQHDVVAIDIDPSAIAGVEDLDMATLVGYGANQEVLTRAGAAEADLVAAVTNHDEVNLIAALAAKQLGAKQVVARAQGNEWASWTEGIHHGLLGVDVVVNPRVLVGRELGRIARSHGAVDVIDLSEASVELVAMKMTTRMANRQLAKLPLPRETLVAAYVRDDEFVIPGGADVLLPDDTVYLLGKPSAVLAAEDLFSAQREARRLMIIGGGVVGQALAREVIPHEIKVTILERKPEVARELAEAHPDITVVCGDGTDQALLKEIEASTYDMCACVTQDDEVNLMAALIAKHIGVSKTAAIVQRADYAPIYRQLGIDVVVSPRTVASDHVLRLGRADIKELHVLHSLHNGEAEVCELIAQPGAPALQVPLRRLSTPKGALIATIVRGGHAQIPHGDDHVEAGDRVLLISTPSARRSVERLFRTKRL